MSVLQSYPVDGCPCDNCEKARKKLVRIDVLMQRPGSIVAVLPTDAATRNRLPLCTGVIDYFPLAIAAIADCSLRANEQHNPGEWMHWARGKSTEHADKILKHLVDRGLTDADGIRHSAKLAWRALALLQTELEEAGGTPGRASVFPTVK